MISAVEDVSVTVKSGKIDGFNFDILGEEKIRSSGQLRLCAGELYPNFHFQEYNI